MGFKGVTTWSSSLSGLVNLNVYAQLDRNGEMPMRFAYSYGMGDTNFPYSVGFYERLGDVAGHGTPHLWSIGVFPGIHGCLPPVLSPHFKTQDAEQAVDRRTVLLMATRWAAEYVLREDVLGSLEPGKWADLVILDKDYLVASEEDFANLQVLLTMVGGKIVYSPIFGG